eukprot:COSAG01_NODE_1638_length_9653_cov_230.802282_12_plen_85_part_00
MLQDCNEHQLGAQLVAQLVYASLLETLLLHQPYELREKQSSATKLNTQVGGKVEGGTCWRCMPLRLILSFSLPAASVMTRSGLW